MRQVSGEGEIPVVMRFSPGCAIPGGVIEGTIETEQGVPGGVSAIFHHAPQPFNVRRNWDAEENVDGIVPFRLDVPTDAPPGGERMSLVVAVVDGVPGTGVVTRSGRAGMELEVARSC